MSLQTSEERIRELARDLAPVRPIPRLRAVFAAVIALGLVALAAHWLLGGPGLRHRGTAVASIPYLATLFGLVLVASGALGAALAVAVPGREAVARVGTRVAAAGVLIAVAGGIVGLFGEGPLAGERVVDCLACMGRAVTLGAASTLLACTFLIYAALRRPGPGAALALCGGVAFGAAAVHVSCPSDSPLHWLLAHTLAPAAAALVLSVPLAALLARRARRA